VTPRERWLAVTWPFVLAQLRPAPATVLEIGCGPAGGFVPDLLRAGYRATGIDPEAPEGPNYHRVEFESDHLDAQVDAVVACTSLHHVADLDLVLDKVAAALSPGGTLVVVEWGWELMDERTAQWGFARLPDVEPDGHPGWLQGARTRWLESGLPWTEFCTQWATEHGMHTGREVFELADTTDQMEQAAAEAGEIQACGSRYVGASRGLSRP
jgi:SAM-dependent methyltransferase